MARRRPSRPAGLVVLPGASATRDHRTMVALDNGLDLPVARLDFRSRSVPKLLDGLAADVAAFAAELGVEPDRLLLGGRSMGGRMCSMLVAGGHPAAGLVLLSYPLHPPGQPESLRVDHFPQITVPCLFVSGTKDPFGTPAEFDAQVGAIAGPVHQVWLEGQRHDPRDDAAVVAAVRSWLDVIWSPAPSSPGDRSSAR